MWFDPNGEEMTEEGWNTAHAKCLGMLLSGDAIDVRTFRNEPILDRTYLLLLNAHHEAISFTLPGRRERALGNGDRHDGRGRFRRRARSSLRRRTSTILGGRSLSLLQLATDAQGEARSASWRKSNKPPISAQKKKAPATEDPAAAPAEAGGNTSETVRADAALGGIVQPQVGMPLRGSPGLAWTIAVLTEGLTGKFRECPGEASLPVGWNACGVDIRCETGYALSPSVPLRPFRRLATRRAFHAVRRRQPNASAPNASSPCAPR